MFCRTPSSRSAAGTTAPAAASDPELPRGPHPSSPSVIARRTAIGSPRSGRERDRRRRGPLRGMPGDQPREIGAPGEGATGLARWKDADMRGLVDHGAWVWPVVLREGDVELRPLRRSDAQVWRAVRSANVSWLTPWEATHPDAEASPPPTFGQMVRSFNREARSGRMLPLAVIYRGDLVGQLTVSGIAWGSLRSAHAGYWVDRRGGGGGHIPPPPAVTGGHRLFSLGPPPAGGNHPPGNGGGRRGGPQTR